MHQHHLGQCGDSPDVDKNLACRTLQACKVAKLFAKHFKVPEQQALLTKTAPAIGVGTPHRLSQLAALGALKLDRLSLVLVDVALDAKQR